jgi:uncharacterized protein YndB with AHSA1/START domain
MILPAKIELEQYYDHPASAIWRALTEPELHAKWWAPGDVRAVVGHSFTLDMGRWGKQPCKVLEVEPERLFRYTFAEGSLDTTITWELVAQGEGTLLKLTHEGFDLDSPMAKAAFEGMKDGWPSVLVRLGTSLATA